MKKQPKQSTLDQIQKMRQASSVKVPSDFAKMRSPTDGVPAETLSELPEAMKANREAKPVIEEAMRQQRIKALGPAGKITSTADNAYKAASKLGGIAKKVPFGKLMAVLGGPIAAGLSTASDAMASEDLGDPRLEEAQLEEAKQEAIRSRLPQEEQDRMSDIENKLAAMASKPLSMQDRLPIQVPPEVSELGEQFTPDIEDGDRLYQFEAEKRKRQLGYK